MDEGRQASVNVYLNHNSNPPLFNLLLLLLSRLREIIQNLDGFVTVILFKRKETNK